MILVILKFSLKEDRRLPDGNLLVFFEEKIPRWLSKYIKDIFMGL